MDFFYYAFSSDFYEHVVGTFGNYGLVNTFFYWGSNTWFFVIYFYVSAYFRRRIKFFEELFTDIIVFYDFGFWKKFFSIDWLNTCFGEIKLVVFEFNESNLVVLFIMPFNGLSQSTFP